MFGEHIKANDSPMFVERPRLCELVNSKLRNTNLLMIKSAPMTGKSAAGRALNTDRGIRRAYSKVFYLDCGSLAQAGVYEYFAEMSNKTQNLHELLVDATIQTPENAVLVVIDAAEKTYSHCDCHPDNRDMWNKLQYRYNNLRGKKSKIGVLDVVLLVTHENKHYHHVNQWWIHANDVIAHDTLAFTECEFERLLEKFHSSDCRLSSADEKVKVHTLLSPSSRVVSHLFKLTSGHVGLSRVLLRLMVSHFLTGNTSKTNFPVLTDPLIEFLNGRVTRNEVSRLLSAEWKGVNFSRYQSCLHDLISGCDVDMACHAAALTSLEKLGLVGQDRCSGRWSFPAPIIKSILHAEYNEIVAEGHKRQQDLKQTAQKQQQKHKQLSQTTQAARVNVKFNGYR